MSAQAAGIHSGVIAVIPVHGEYNDQFLHRLFGNGRKMFCRPDHYIFQHYLRFDPGRLLAPAALVMYCPTYRCTMSSQQCLRHQRYAAGKDIKNRFTQGILENIQILQQRYKVCLDCQTGKQITKTNGEGMDEDVAMLKEKVKDNQTHWCRYCNKHRPVTEFYQSNGKILPECKQCASDRHRRKREESKAVQLIDAIASNNSSESIENAIANKKENNIDTLSIESKNINAIENAIKPLEEPISDSQGKVIAWREVSPSTPAYDLPSEPPVCKICGLTKSLSEMHAVGKNLSQYCNDCIKAKRQQSWHDNRKHNVVLNFAEDLELLEELKNAAKRSRRTVDNEILFRLASGAES